MLGIPTKLFLRCRKLFIFGKKRLQSRRRIACVVDIVRVCAAITNEFVLARKHLRHRIAHQGRIHRTSDRVGDICTVDDGELLCRALNERQIVQIFFILRLLFGKRQKLLLVSLVAFIVGRQCL